MGNDFFSGDAPLCERISKLLSLFPDRKTASEISGKSADMLWSYTKGRHSPSFEALARLALVKNVDLNWLASGRGSMFLSEDGAHQGRHSYSDEQWLPLIPQILKVRIVSALLNSEKQGEKPSLKRIADDILHQYEGDLPLYMSGLLPIPDHDIDERQIENLRQK